MDKFINKNCYNILKADQHELLNLQRNNGKPLSLIGDIVYLILNCLGYKQKMFYDICPYFEIGKDWGAISLGWFFVCCEGMSERTKCHEVGHTLQNANIGGWKMIGLSLISIIRCWCHILLKIDSSMYDLWWFEGQATELGTKYVEIRKNKT